MEIFKVCVGIVAAISVFVMIIGCCISEIKAAKKARKEQEAAAEAEKKRPPDEHYGILQSFTQNVSYDPWDKKETVSFSIKLSNGIKLNLKRNGVKTYKEPPFGKMVCIKHKRKELISMVEV